MDNAHGVIFYLVHNFIFKTFRKLFAKLSFVTGIVHRDCKEIKKTE
jgi:hypothetical protein